ncbi:MAG: drug/metabolite transporter (DMT)-like permease [bacterium]|jgi:drug/metabolite transporter (DMT)-like permease
MQTASEENHIAGIGWMLLTMALFVSMDTVVKYLIQEFSPLQIVWARFFFHMVWISVFVHKTLLTTFISGNYKLQLLRSALLVTTTALFFNGLRTTALSTATVIMFLSPIFVTLLAIPLLGEKVGLRRLIGVLIGFLGAVVIIHPRTNSDLTFGTETVVPGAISWLPELGHLLIIGAALSNALYQLMTRKVRAVDSATTTLLYSGVVGAIAMSLWAPIVWKPPQAFDWLLMACVGLLGCVSHFCLIRAFRNAPASLVVPFSYSSLLWATLLGYLVFNALPDQWTLIGATLIISSGLYIFYREHVLSKAAK